MVANTAGRRFSPVTWTGWRRLATYLTILVSVLSILLIIFLIISVNVGRSQGKGFQEETVIWETDCTTTARANLWIHLAINLFATGILGSSNFFMQVLVAPTRREIDQAHASGRWVEIGCNSIRNFRLLPRRKTFLWLLFTLSSVPLHLVFNSCVLESKASNALHQIIASEGFLADSPWSYPGMAELYTDLANDYWWPEDNESKTAMIAKIQKDPKSINKWESIDFQQCKDRYDHAGRVVSDYRHVILVAKFLNGTQINGWDGARLVNHSSAFPETNSLWDHQVVLRTGPARIPYYSGTILESFYTEINDLNDTLTVSSSFDLHAQIPDMLVDRCLSKVTKSPCKILVANKLLLIVCIMCCFKCFLCMFTLLNLRFMNNEEPLMTPGDAIASFIARPGADSKGMCTLGSQRQDACAQDTPYSNLEGLSPWQRTKRTSGKSIPWNIWILSFLFTGSCLAIGLAMCILATCDQPM